MRKPMPRTLIRAIGLGLGLAALPFAFQTGVDNIDEMPALKINQACAQAGGKCVFEINAICTFTEEWDYHHYLD
jgi:hypothetical protein